MEIDVRVTIDQKPQDAEEILELEDEVRDQIFDSAPIMICKVVILRNDGFGTLLPDGATELERE